jgi:hypothetical protein
MKTACPRNGTEIELPEGVGPVVCLPCKVTLRAGEGSPRYRYCAVRDAIHSEQTQDPEEDELLPRFRGHELREQLGHGGSGVVYRAWSHHLQRDVALKVLAAGQWASPKQRMRFQREVMALAELDVPGVVPILDVGTSADGAPWFAMELVAGPPLAALVRQQGILPITEAARIVHDLALVLQAVHEAGLVHRDLKPSNVLLDSEGRPFLVDFGLALGGVEDRLTRSTQVVGTPRYLAPEQLAADVQDWRLVDIHGLGLILHEAVTGRVDRGLDGSFETSGSSHSGEALDLLWIARRAAALNPRDRYPDAVTMARDLGSWLEGRRVVPLTHRLGRRVAPWLRSGRTTILLAAGALMGLGALGIASSWLDGRRERQREERAAAFFEASRVELERLVEKGEREEEAARFDDIAANPVLSGTRVLEEAWLARGEKLLALGEVEASAEAYSVALVLSERSEPKAEAVRGLLGVYETSWNPWRTAVLLDSLPSMAPGSELEIPEQLRTRSAVLSGRYREALQTASPEQVPIIQLLRSASVLERRPVGVWDLDGDGITLPVYGDGDGRADEVTVREGSWLAQALGETWLVRADGDSTTIALARPDGPELRWVLPRTRIVQLAGLDGRLYAAVTNELSGLFLLDEGGLVLADPASAAFSSPPVDMVSGDLDGDGRDELVVAFGQPWLWAVRVFHSRDDGTLELTDERRWTDAGGVAIAQTARGPRLVVTDGRPSPSRRLFPAAEGVGSTALEVLALRGGELVVEERLEIPWLEGGAQPALGELSACDVDGDGVDEIFAGMRASVRGQRRSQALALGWRDDGSLGDALVVPETWLRWCGQADEDPADEVLLDRHWVGVDTPDTPVLLGTGAADLPHEDLPVPLEPPSIAAALRSLELHRALALNVGRDERVSPTLAVARAQQRAGQDRAALYAALRALRDGAGREAAEASLEFALDAQDPLLSLRSLAEQPDVVRALDLEDARWLQALAAPERRLELGPGAIEPQLPWPDAMSHDLRTGVSNLRVPLGAGPVLRVPLVRGEGPIWLRLEGQLHNAEIGSDVQVMLRPVGSDEPDWSLDLAAWTTGGYSLRRVVTPHLAHEWEQEGETAFTASYLVQADGLARSTFERDGERRLTEAIRRAPAARGRWELLVSGPEVLSYHHAQGRTAELRIDRFELGGFELAPDDEPPEPSPWLLWADGAGPLPLRGLPAANAAGLAVAVRLRPHLIERVRAELGQEVALELLALLWAENAHYSWSDDRVGLALLGLGPEHGRDARWAAILRARGWARARMGLEDEARTTLLEAAAIAEEASADGWFEAFRAHALLADLALASGDRAEALRQMRACLDSVGDRELGLRLLRFWPQMAGYESSQRRDTLVQQVEQASGVGTLSR